MTFAGVIASLAFLPLVLIQARIGVFLGLGDGTAQAS
jgi:hypothetical protein